MAIANIIQHISTCHAHLDQVTAGLKKILQEVRSPPSQPESLREHVTIEHIEKALKARHFDKPMEVTIAVATALANGLDINSPSREEKRQRRMLLEWFLRHWAVIEPHLKDLCAYDKSHNEIVFSSSSDNDYAASDAELDLDTRNERQG